MPEASNPHAVVSDILFWGLALFIVAGIVLYFLENARANLPEMLREPRRFLVPLVGTFASIGVIAFAIGASLSLAALIGLVAAGALLLVFVFAG